MDTIQTLQDLINNRAAKRLDKDLATLCDTIQGSPLLFVTDSDIPKLQTEKSNGELVQQVPYWVFQFNAQTGQTSLFMDRLRAYWLPKYQEAETREFLEKFTRIESEVEDLKRQSENLDY